MWSVPSRRSDSSAAALMVAAESPLYAGWAPTLVATTMSERLERAASHLPMTVSDSPPSLPGIHAEYASAVSRKLPPAATYASSTANDCASSAVQPKTLPPSASGKTWRSEEPSLRREVINGSTDSTAAAIPYRGMKGDPHGHPHGRRHRRRKDRVTADRQP